MRVRAWLTVGLIAAVLQIAGCGSSGSEPGEVSGSRISAQAVRNGCHMVCTTCAPGTRCLRRCRLECPQDVVSCGSNMCRNGDVCCNESCGICAPPGGSCTQQVCGPTPPCVDTVLCIRGFHWSPTQCACVPDGSCVTDDDCRLIPDFCTGCDCRALSVQEPDPTCPGPGVRCFADPCMSLKAMCLHGQCASFRTSTGPHAPRQPHAPHAPRAPGGRR